MNEVLHIVCPHCDAVNRIPVARRRDGSNCGKCHRRLFSGHSIELTTVNFQKHYTRGDLPVLVDFWAAWCGPCMTMVPAFEQAAGQLEPRVRLAKANTEAEPILATQFGIRSIPTLALFKGSRAVTRQAGAMAVDIVR